MAAVGEAGTASGEGGGLDWEMEMEKLEEAVWRARVFWAGASLP